MSCHGCGSPARRSPNSLCTIVRTTSAASAARVLTVLTVLTVLAAAGGFLVLPVAPAWGADTGKAAASDVQTDAVQVTTVLIKGGG